MKYSIVALALSAAPFASASSLDSIPSCAESAVNSGISATGCDISDFACICGNAQFVTSVYSLIKNDCSAADQQVTLAFASDVCKSVGVSLNIPTAAAAATTSSIIPPATSASSVPSAIETASSASSPPALPTPSAPYAFANGSSSINGTNSTIPFTGGAVGERSAVGFQLGGSALGVAVLVGLFL